MREAAASFFCIQMELLQENLSTLASNCIHSFIHEMSARLENNLIDSGG